MKKLSLRKEILLVVAILVVTFALSTSVFATSTNPIQIPVINANTTTDTNTTDNTTTNTTANTTVDLTPVTPTTNTATNTTGSTYENTTLPQTGDASDYAIFAVIGLCIIIAVVAFKKARNYNI